MLKVSPRTLVMGSYQTMLGGETPTTESEYLACMAYIAANVSPIDAVRVCILIAHLYFFPFTDDEVKNIVISQWEEVPLELLV